MLKSTSVATRHALPCSQTLSTASYDFSGGASNTSASESDTAAHIEGCLLLSPETASTAAAAAHAVAAPTAAAAPAAAATPIGAAAAATACGPQLGCRGHRVAVQREEFVSRLKPKGFCLHAGYHLAHQTFPIDAHTERQAQIQSALISHATPNLIC
eukprot:CAMPEP_0171891300 /NCGR_PEP_ID=MMETSP0992-20121227/44662_1 /TAXON_ID=483369 /ORGANISM="non described non described, Strain CCMP2098" /LENGTH=156 /DNA_ID=CAMNT_0012518619 /DNA_START=49 /DNA_END=519 /DNA_ORIENTATION=-